MMNSLPTLARRLKLAVQAATTARPPTNDIAWFPTCTAASEPITADWASTDARMRRFGVQLALGVGLVSGGAVAQATTIVSDNPKDQFIITEHTSPGYYTDRLTDWLGKGSLTLTSIFDQQIWQQNNYQATGEYRFPLDEIDEAVSGKGPTFTLFYATDLSSGQNSVMGWYNPVNGVTAAGGNAGETSADSFIFNLTTNRLLRPIFDPNPTVTNINAGTDIFLGADGTGPGRGITYVESFGDSFLYKTVLWSPSSNNGQSNPTHFAYQYLAVYSISVDSLAVAAPVPEPASWALSLAGLGIVGALHRHRHRRRNAPAALA